MAPHKLSLLNSTLPLCARLLCRFASPSSLFVSRRDAEVQSFLDRINKIKSRWVFSHKEQEHEEGGGFGRKERRDRKGLAVRSFRIGALPQTPKNLCVIPEESGENREMGKAGFWRDFGENEARLYCLKPRPTTNNAPKRQVGKNQPQRKANQVHLGKNAKGKPSAGSLQRG